MPDSLPHSRRPARRARLPIHTTAGAVAVLTALLAAPVTAGAATTVQIGTTGRTFASTAPLCAVHPVTGQSTPQVQAGLFNPRRNTEADVSLNGARLGEVDSTTPTTDVWLATGSNTVAVALSRRQTDRYTFHVAADLCSVVTTPGNFFSADGTLEYAASGKSYLTVTPGCALNPATGLTQPFVNLFDNGSFLLNVSLNGVPLTQLSALRPRAVVFLGAGRQVITAANGSVSVDTFVRDGGTGACTL